MYVMSGSHSPSRQWSSVSGTLNREREIKSFSIASSFDFHSHDHLGATLTVVEQTSGTREQSLKGRDSEAIVIVSGDN